MAGVTAAILREAPWLNRERLCGYATLLIAVSGAALAWSLTGHGIRDPAGRPIGTDFLSFWTVSRALIGGRQRLVYDPAALAALERTTLGGAGTPFLTPFAVAALLAALLARLRAENAADRPAR
jgi:alpha-1,2-mannosyltransferase